MEGRNSSSVPQEPPALIFPSSLLPWASTSVMTRNVPEDALTVTGALGGTSTARLAGDTSSTAAVVPALVVVEGVGEACCAVRVAGGFGEPLPIEPAAALPKQASSRTATATDVTARTRPGLDFIDNVATFNRLPKHGVLADGYRTPREAGQITPKPRQVASHVSNPRPLQTRSYQACTQNTPCPSEQRTGDASDGVLPTEVLERPADDREGGQEHANDGQPPARGQAEEHDRRGRSQGQRPPAVRAEEPVLPLGGRDECRWVILGSRVQLAAGLPQVEADQGGHSGAQEQPKGPDRLTPVGEGAVDEPDDNEEHPDHHEQPELDLHRR